MIMRCPKRHEVSGLLEKRELCSGWFVEEFERISRISKELMRKKMPSMARRLWGNLLGAYSAVRMLNHQLEAPSMSGRTSHSKKTGTTRS